VDGVDVELFDQGVVCRLLGLFGLFCFGAVHFACGSRLSFSGLADEWRFVRISY
jgi:hypothetical protein